MLRKKCRRQSTELHGLRYLIVGAVTDVYFLHHGRVGGEAMRLTQHGKRRLPSLHCAHIGMRAHAPESIGVAHGSRRCGRHCGSALPRNCPRCYRWSSKEVGITNVDCSVSSPYIRRGLSGDCRCSDAIAEDLGRLAERACGSLRGARVVVAKATPNVNRDCAENYASPSPSLFSGNIKLNSTSP